MDLVRVLINGSDGRMGQESVKAISEDPELDLVAQTDLHDNLTKIILDTKFHEYFPRRKLQKQNTKMSPLPRYIGKNENTLKKKNA